MFLVLARTQTVAAAFVSHVSEASASHGHCDLTGQYDVVTRACEDRAPICVRMEDAC